jgi:hypothetical protein
MRTRRTRAGVAHETGSPLGATALVVASALAAHGRSIGFDFTGLDDRAFIVDDRAFLLGTAGGSWSSLLRAFGRSYMHVVDPDHPYYRPLVTLSYAVDARWSGLSPSGYHATNVARSPASLVLAGGWVAGVAGRLFVHAFSTGAASGDGAREAAVHALPRLAASLGQLTVPVDPSLLSDPEDLSVWPGLVCAALALVAVRFAPGLRPRVVALGAAVFVLGLAPALAVPGALVLGSRLYLPAVGVPIAAAEIVRAVARERSVLVAFSGVTVAALALVTVAFEGTFRDRRVFARSAVVSAPTRRSPISASVGACRSTATRTARSSSIGPPSRSALRMASTTTSRSSTWPPRAGARPRASCATRSPLTRARPAPTAISPSSCAAKGATTTRAPRATARGSSTGAPPRR